VRHRLIFGPVFIALVVALVWLDEWTDHRPLSPFWRNVFMGLDTPPPGVVLFLLSVVVSVLASRELARIMRDKGIAASKRIVTSAAIAGLVVSCLVPQDLPGEVAAQVVSTAAAAVLLLSLAYYSRHKTVQGAVAAAGGTLLAFVYLGLMFGFLLAIRREHPAWVLLWVLMTTKACDIGAFFTGVAIGRHKLILWLSPGKTWEGLFGGVLFAAVVGGLGRWILVRVGITQQPGVWEGAAAGAVFGIVGQTGDLVASLFKRDAGIKDSSRLLPGFGGILDVIDSPLLVAPVAYWWLHAAARAAEAGA
jgi:phosphatidate cytidylyltransferase